MKIANICSNFNFLLHSKFSYTIALTGILCLSLKHKQVAIGFTICDLNILMPSEFET